VEGVDRYLEQLGKSLEVLLPAAEKLGLTIALENLLPVTCFGFSPEHITRIRETFDHPHLGFCLDTGHALVSLGDAAAEIQDAMGDRLVAYHLADTAGDRDSHLAPGHGRVEWATVFRKAAEGGFSGHMCIETPPFARGPSYSSADWKQMVDDCDELVAAALANDTDEAGVK
jgi:sugar phosphate isomerase/epimerase